MKKAVIYTITFALIQLIISPIVMLIWKFFSDTPHKTMDAPMLITAMTISSLLILAIFLGLKWAVVSPTYLRSRPWDALFWCVIAAIGAIIPSMWLQEIMPELPNYAEDTLTAVMNDRWGYWAVGILAPVGEEIVFRGAVLRVLLGWFHHYELSHWVAIVFSAIFFALVHANPAQMPHAFIIGLLLGWFYYRTDSIIPGIAYHWVNNTAAFVLFKLYPDPDLTLSELFGSQLHVAAAVFFSILIIVPAIFQLNIRLRKAA